MEKLFINAIKEGYSTNQCRKTMTVGELIELLQNYEPETEIFIKNDGGYTYGSIEEDRIELAIEEE